MSRARFLILLPCLGLLSGCIVAAAAAAGTGVLYVQGAALRSFPHDVERTYAGTVAALEEADIIITTKTYDAVSGKVTGTGADGKKVTVDLKSKGDGVTEVKVRVGTLGDRGRSEYLIGKIDEKV